MLSTQHFPLDELPADILLLIYLRLSPEDLVAVILISRSSHRYISRNNEAWNHKIQIHFPHAAAQPKEKTPYSYFGELYKKNYSNLYPTFLSRNFFGETQYYKTKLSLTKEGDTRQLIKLIKLKDIDIEDNNQVTLLETIRNNPRLQPVLNYLFYLATDAKMKNRSIIYYAVAFRQIEFIENRIRKGCNLELPDADGNFIIHYACKHGELEIVQLLLDKFAGHINITNSFGETPLMLAAANGHLPTVEFLMKQGADPDIQAKPNSYYYIAPKIHYTALHWACLNNHPAIAKFLINNEANLLLYSNNQVYAIHLACLQTDDAELINLMLEKQPALINKVSCFDGSPLHCAAARGCMQTTIALLIKHNANAFTQSYNNQTADHFATNYRVKNIIRLQQKFIQNSATGFINSLFKDDYTTAQAAAILRSIILFNKADKSDLDEYQHEISRDSLLNDIYQDLDAYLPTVDTSPANTQTTRVIP